MGALYAISQDTLTGSLEKLTLNDDVAVLAQSRALHGEGERSTGGGLTRDINAGL